MRELTPLCLLARKYETDKGGRHMRYGGGDSDTCHEYTPVYWDLFAERRHQVQRVLEIGINAGSSLRMWAEFFPHATVYGIDCNPRTLFEGERIRCLLADQGNEASLLEAVQQMGGGGFDLIVDDGSHETSHQIVSLRTLAPLLSDDGVYVVEDLQVDCHPELVGQHAPEGFAWRAYATDMGIGKAHCPCSECGGRAPEQLLVVERQKKKKSVTLVTAFCRLGDRAVNEGELLRHFEQLAACGLPIILFLDHRIDYVDAPPNVRVVPTDIEKLCPFDRVDDRPLPERRATKKDTRDFLLLQNSKLDLLERACELDDSPYFAWIDFGVMKVVRDAARFHEKLRNLKPWPSCVLAPGCWDKSEDAISTNRVNWRFCGGFLLADRARVGELVEAHHEAFARSPVLTWEVNAWAEMERSGTKFDWYKADHDDRLVDAPAKSPSVCLVMIVKNEGAIIERCLAAAIPFIDTWVIADTGSTDGTGDIVERFFANRSMPGKLVRTTFRDFAQARNAALDAARAVEGWDYALLVDADMVLSGSLDKRSLDASAYRLMQRNGMLDYWNVRLVRRNAAARYVGVTHEFLAVEGYVDLPTLTIDDRNDGGSKGDKSDRDIRLLNGGLAREPHNERYMFYLANTYREAGRHDEAIQWYRRRIDRGGWEEEVWSSYYGIARSHLALGDEPEFIRACLDAYNYRPTRGEPLKLLARYYRDRGKSDAALLFAGALSWIDYPSDVLFVERDVYEHGADQEIGIAGFYSRVPARHEAGYRACAHLTLHPLEYLRNEARRNFAFYAKSARELFGADVCEIDWKPSDGWAPMNPSVYVSRSGRRLVLARTVNYKVTEQGQYPTADGSGIIRTRNHIVELDANWKPVSSKLIEDATGKERNGYAVEGFEDCRLWTKDGQYHASATVRDLGDGRCEMSVLTFDDQWRIIDVDVVRDYEHDKPQKNWMPVVGRGGWFVYLCDPTVVVERASGHTIERARSEPAWSLVDARGGSQLIEYGDGWICLVHEVAWRPERVYLHRFIQLDEELRIVKVSDPFYFERVGIEFCAGLARDGDKIVASFGVNDASAHLALFDSESIDRALRAR